jgi:hypothetical protein
MAPLGALNGDNAAPVEGRVEAEALVDELSEEDEDEVLEEDLEEVVVPVMKTKCISIIVL